MAETHIIPFPQDGKGEGPLTMSSREIAELCEKNHAHVMRDIRTMLDGLGEGQSKFGSAYIDAQGKESDCYNLPKDLTLTLVAGYNVKLRHRIVVRWMELEKVQAPALTADTTEQITRMFGIMKQMSHRSAEQSREIAVLKDQITAVSEVVKPSVPGVFRAGKTPGAILKSEGFENCPPGTAAWFGNKLEDAGALISGKLDTGTAKSRLFDVDLAHEWLNKGGRAAVARHIAEKKGQGALAIPGMNKRRMKKMNAQGRGILVMNGEAVTYQAGMTVCPGEEALLVMSQDGLHFGIGTRTMTGYDVTKTTRFGPPQGAMGMLPIFIVVGRVLDRQPLH